MKSNLFVQRMKMRQRTVLTLLVPIALSTSLLFSGCSTSTPLTSATSATRANEPATTDNAVPVVSLYDEEAIVTLYSQAIPAVVEINTVVGGKEYPSDLFRTPDVKGQGSGFFVDEEGHILTNYHVVDGASSISVTLHSSETVDAQIIGTDSENDLALLKVDPININDISPLLLGDSDSVKPGQMAIALGSPYGLEGSITVGIISGLGRTMAGTQTRSIPNMLQTDAAINPGNSGGPLLNSKGSVIGINTAIEASSNNIGFAIPINNAKSLLPALLQGGEVGTPWLGISGTAIDQTLASKLNLATDHGVYVVSVMPDSPAERAGLVPSGTDQGDPTSGGDIITAIDGHEVTTVSDLLQYLNTRDIGEQVSLTVIRGDETIAVEVTLDEWPQDVAFSQD
ncbi:MAG: trypsin-like peptidase domain-containing protein [Dehalococcoidales bacterium]|nr:trypsin-like peptidase domain-containing protein [Dehalococcoidales bacterium]